MARIQSAVNELQKTSKAAALMRENLNVASAKLNQKDNAIGLLTNDPKTAGQITAIMTNQETNSQKLDEDLEAIQSNFFFKGFFKKKVKEEEIAKKEAVKENN